MNSESSADAAIRFRRCLQVLLLLFVLVAGCHKGGKPSTPYLFGPSAGQPGETLFFRAVARDPQGGNLSYRFDWADGSTPVWTTELGSGDTFELWHVFADSGRRSVTVRCRNEERVESGESGVLAVQVGFLGPVTPPSPLGPEQAIVDSMLVFTAGAQHVRGESVSVQFDWGDTLGSWTGFVPAGATVADSHRYKQTGMFAVRVRARDRAGNTSPWSAAAPVIVGLEPLGRPLNLRLSAVAGVQVRVRWDTGGNEDSVRYAVWFRQLDSAGFVKVGEVAGTYVNHDPLGTTGSYTVSARRSVEEVFATETLSTVPVFSDTVVVHELNADSASGYGWDSVSGASRQGSMLDTSDAGRIDWYFTDLGPGYMGPAFYLAGAEFGPEDPGGVVPPGPWRRARLMGMLGNVQDPLPEYDSLYYQRVVDVSSFEARVAVHTPEGRYALVCAYGPNPSNGTIRVVSWFQPIPGLRLIQHPKPVLK
jgi:hypothetical protein